ncbi:MAG TPA: SGNH/GDSL hydrolase family protein [Myxococcota bacterium]|nr:SGNH/GDSL hydrolase family protein [Myxococcota bacterium]
MVGGLLVGAVAAELGARMLQPRGASDLLFNAPDNSPQGLYSGSRELFSLPTPGFTATQTSLGYSVDLRINSHALRGPELGAKSQPRWLAIGDSFTFAAQVAEEDSFTVLSSGALGLEVLNAGVDGYGTWQATRRYELLAQELDLDGALLTFFVGNDLTDNDHWPNTRRIAENFVEGEPLDRLQRDPLTAWLSRHSYLYGRLQVRRAAEELASGNSPNQLRWRMELELFHEDGAHRLRDMGRTTQQELRDLRDKARRNGDGLLVAVAPPAFAVDQGRVAPTFELVGLDAGQARVEAPEEALMEILESERISACNLGPPLRQAESQGVQTYLEYDGHWTVEGHRVVAETLAACWEARSP